MLFAQDKLRAAEATPKADTRTLLERGIFYPGGPYELNSKLCLMNKNLFICIKNYANDAQQGLSRTA